MLGLRQILRTLATNRPIFHSEADFQHALAWEIHTAKPAASIRLELPVQIDGSRRIHLDLLVEADKERYVLELKYKSIAMMAQVNGEQFALLNQAAQDFGRYDFLKDVMRLERYVAWAPNSIGYAIFISNNALYWNESRLRKV
jgi:hypothetical protein